MSISKPQTVCGPGLVWRPPRNRVPRRQQASEDGPPNKGSLFSESFVYQPPLIRRLWEGFVEASRELREDPKTFIASAFSGEAIGGHRRKMLLRMGLAIAIVFYVILFMALLISWSIHRRSARAARAEVDIIHIVNADDFRPQSLDMPKAEKKAGGGGGGGRNTPTPPSKGQLPKFSLQQPIIAPRPEPQFKPPALPIVETVQVDPRLEPQRDELALTGLPTGVPGPPSPGPGSGGGMGSGSGGGMGPGEGRGVGPGRGYNMGGGDPVLGGGSLDPNAPAPAVDTRPVPLNSPKPNYTEEARRNKIQGVVTARVLIGPDGSVKQVKVTRGLPDGLNEEAIRAAYQMRFRPAMKSGQPVAYWVTLEVGFTLR